MLPQIEEIVKRRRMLGLTQKQLARLAGVSQSLIAKLESGKINPSYDKVKAIFDALEKLENNVDIRVSDILHSEVIGIQKNESVAQAVKLMVEYGFSQLPVFDGDRIVGSISEKTIMGKLSSTKDFTQISRLPVESIMEESFPQVGKNAPIKLVSSLLNVYSAVLVSEKGKIVGIVTKADLLKVLL